MPDIPFMTLGLAFFVPIGYALLAAAGLPAERARRAAVSFFAALGLAAVGYAVTGFGLQFGGVGLIHEQPGFDGLIWEWSALGPTWGPGWGMAGLAGWGLSAAAATSAAQALALANLPWVVTAALIPLLGLRGRIPAWASGFLGLLMGGLLYPLAGNWVWGGGWLANLGGNLGFGHGLVDIAGSGSVHLLGAAALLAGLLVFLPRLPRSAPDAPVPLPKAHFPVLAILGSGLLLIGATAWVYANPLIDAAGLDPARLVLGVVLAAAGGALVPLIYTRLIAGTADPLMAARGLGAAIIAGLAVAPFAATWAALGTGLMVGLLTPFVVFTVDHIVRWNDPGAVLAVHGLGGSVGLLAVGLLADGTAGAGWNGIGAGQYLGVPFQGITGWLAASGFQPDWPGQIKAQVVGIAAFGLFGFFAAWLLVALLAALFVAPRRRDETVDLVAPPASEPADQTEATSVFADAESLREQASPGSEM